MQKWLLQLELLPTKPDSAAEDAPQHVPAAFVGGDGAVRHRKSQTANVIGNHAKRDIRAQLRIGGLGGGVGAVGFRKRSRVLLPTQLREPGKERVPQIDGIVAVHILQHLADALETHARINVLCRKRGQAAVGIAVVLNEDEIPDLHDARVVSIYVLSAGLVGSAVNVDFRARSTRPGFAHFPEVVLPKIVNVRVG